MNYRTQARNAAVRHGIDPDVFERQINQESGFNPSARSPAGAVGIAQFEPGTAKSVGVDPMNPVQALDGAAKLMAGYIRKYGSYRDALVAYNAGPARVGRALPRETQNYIATILGGKEPAATPRNRLAHSLASRGTETASAGMGGSQTPDPASAMKVAILTRLLGADNPLVTTGALDARFDVTSPTLGERTIGNSVFRTGPAGHPAVRSTNNPYGQVIVSPGAERPGVHLQRPVLDFLHQLAGASGRPVDVTTGTNHNQYVAGEPGVQSDHWTGNAADLGQGGDARTNSAVARKGDLVAAHAIAIAGRVPFQQALKMAQKGGVFNFNTKAGRVQVLWKTLVGGNHYNHVHIGVKPNA